jgi:hypothetical protein
VVRQCGPPGARRHPGLTDYRMLSLKLRIFEFHYRQNKGQLSVLWGLS